MALRALAVFDLVHQLDQPRHQRCRDAGLRAECHDRAELRVRLGAALAHRDVPPDAAVRLGRPPVERDHLVERPLRHFAGRLRREGVRIEAVEAFRRDVPRAGDAHHLARDFDVDVAIPGIGQRVRDGVVGERGREQLRAVGQFAPEVAPDVRRHDGGVVEVAKRAVELADPRCHTSVDLTEHHRAPPGVLDRTRLEVVRSEIDEAAHRARVADNVLDDQLV